MPDLFSFASWIFQAADLGAEYSDGRAIAYGAMCRMMSRRHDQPIPENLLPHFYRLVIKGLLSRDLKIYYAIIMNSSNIFNLPLPGCYVLIPTFISSIEKEVCLLEGLISSFYRQRVKYRSFIQKSCYRRQSLSSHPLSAHSTSTMYQNRHQTSTFQMKC